MKNESIEKIKQLVEKFKQEDGWGKSEEHIQTSFSIELLKILGWASADWTINQVGDVKTGKKPDIVLKHGMAKLLVIESKDASKKDMLDGSYGAKTFKDQLVGYCVGEGLPWGALTNFVEWRIYSAHRHVLCGNKKYAFLNLLWPGADKSNYIDIFSKEGLNFLDILSKEVLVARQGKIDSDPVYYPEQKDLAQEKIKKEFFEKIKNWRAQLKKHIEKYYSDNFDAEKIDVIAQKIIDRFIFMDICHDKGVITENHLTAVLSSRIDKYDELKKKFRLMDEKFNTELFAPGDADEILIDDSIIVPIIRELDEIDFSKLSVHIIGEVYENYLGELLRSSDKKTAATEDKEKKKRKSQGIYYTPDYIVDYIIKNTVGELLAKAKTEVEIENIKVIDPACGSGSFLIRAFDEFYNAYQRVRKEGGLFSFDIRRKILQTNLYGVDLDAKAVEIAKLNLMIKALEGVTPKDLSGSHLLPNLNLNIRCGNSLVGGEKLFKNNNAFDLFTAHKQEVEKLIDLKHRFYRGGNYASKKEILEQIEVKEELINSELNVGLKQYFNEVEKVRPFNYSVAFCEVMKSGGFDVVIGNPPYVRPHHIDLDIKNFLWKVYDSFKAKSDLYACFIERGIDINRNSGLFSFIVSNTWLSLESFDNLRDYILKNTSILKLVLPSKKVFKDAQVSTIIFVFKKEKNKNSKIIIEDLDVDKKPIEKCAISQNDFLLSHKHTFDLSLADGAGVKIKKKVEKLEDVVNFYYGLKTADDEKFVTTTPQNDIEYKKLLRRSDFSRYTINYGGEYVWYRPDLMTKNKKTARPGDAARFENSKIVVTDIAKKIIATLDVSNFYIKDALILKSKNFDYDLKFLLGIINSRLTNYIYTKTFKNLSVAKNAFLQIPVITVVNQSDKKMRDELIQLVSVILDLNKSLDSRVQNKTKIAAVDYQIDQLVYKLYGLTDEEIRIVEAY